MGWTAQERLICVTEDGSVVFYTVLGEIVHQFSLGNEVASTKVIDVKFWPHGFVKFNNNNNNNRNEFNLILIYFNFFLRLF